jgi:hypothetical protein
MRFLRAVGCAAIGFVAVYYAMVTSVGPLDATVHLTRPIAVYLAGAAAAIGFVLGRNELPGPL